MDSGCTKFSLGLDWSSLFSVKIGLALPTIDLAAGRTASLAELGTRALAAEQLGFDSLWVMDHLWVERGGIRGGGHDPFVTLAYLAARTERVQLGTLVLCNSFRHPGQLARETAALSDASGGRFICGLGAGWHQPEYDAFGFPFDHKVSRLAETLEVIGPLLKGERVTHEGRFYQLREASTLVTAPAAPVWVAGGQPRMMDLIARHADGWNTAWLGGDPAPFSGKLLDLHAAIDKVGRPRDQVEISVGVFALPEVGADSSDGKAITGGRTEVAEALNRYREAGADHVIVSLSVLPFTEMNPAYPEALAEAIRLL